MSALDARLNRLVPGLSARERFLLEVRNRAEGTRTDAALRNSMPAGQVAEFNHYIGLAVDVHSRLGPYTIVTALLVEKLSLKASGVLVAGQFALNLYEMAELVPAAKRRRVESLLADGYFPVDLPWDPPARAGTYLTHADKILDVVRGEIEDRWLDVQAIEHVLAEIAEDFGGPEIDDEVIRAQLAGATSTLMILAESLGVERPVLQADSPALASVREILREECRSA